MKYYGRARPIDSVPDCCPHCGHTDGFYFTDWGIAMDYYGLFGDIDSIESSEICHTRPKPKTVYCERCEKRIRLEN